MRIAFVHFPGRLARLEAARAGTAPTEFLFGAVELQRAGHEIEHYEVDPGAKASRVLQRLVDRNAGVGHLPPHLAAAPLAQTHALMSSLRRAEVVVATTTGTAMALASWRRLGRFKVPLVGIVAGLLNHPWRRTRRLTTLPLLCQMHVVLYGPGELDGILGLGSRLAGRVHVVPFGVDSSFWSPGSEEPRRDVLAIGNDGHRDWPTLVEAARELDVPVRILTRHDPPAQLPANVTWQEADWYRRLLSDAEVRELYRRAGVVVVPVRDVPQPSGQSVTLQAMACGRPVVLSRTRGLWAPESLHDGENVVLCGPGDAGGLARAVRELLEQRGDAAAIGAAARAGVLAGGAVDVYAERLLEVCREAVASP